MQPADLQRMLQPVFDIVAEGAIDADLAARLNDAIPAGGDTFKEIEWACLAAIEAGWMCAEGAPGRRFGRVIQPSPETRDLSVDVVQLENIIGPHHRHPTGEICLTLPQTEGAEFDGQGAGWCVNEPGSGHFPTVRGGEALVLYLLPGGEIDFTGRKHPKH